MFAYTLTKQQEPFDSSNGLKELIVANIRYFNFVKGKQVITINHLMLFCFRRIINLLIQTNNFITVID